MLPMLLVDVLVVWSYALSAGPGHKESIRMQPKSRFFYGPKRSIEMGCFGDIVTLVGDIGIFPRCFWRIKVYPQVWSFFGSYFCVRSTPFGAYFLY